MCLHWHQCAGCTAQASSQLGGGMNELSVPQAPTPPPLGRWLVACLARAGTGSLNSTPTPSPGTGSALSVLTPSLYLGAPAANTGQAQGPGRAMGVEGAGHAHRTLHLSKPEVTRLGDRGTALGHGAKTAHPPRGVRFRTGEIQRSLRAQCCC